MFTKRNRNIKKNGGIFSAFLKAQMKETVAEIWNNEILIN